MLFYRIKREDFNNIDCIKVCMAVLVVATHTSLFSIISNPYISVFINTALAIKVPIFFTASGFLVWNKICNATLKNKLQRISSWIKKTARLYSIWTLIYLPFTIYGFAKDNMGIIKSCIVFLRNTILIGENYMSWPLWYLLGMLTAGIIIYYLVKSNCKMATMYLAAAACAILGTILDYCHSEGICNIITYPYFKLFQTTRNGFFQGLPYIMIGIAIANEGILKSKKWLTGILILSFIAHMAGIKLATFIMTYALFSLIIQFDLPKRKDNLYRNCRLTSTIVYFVHMLFVASITIFTPIEIPNYLLFIVVVILSFITAGIAIRHKESKIVKILFR